MNAVTEKTSLDQSKIGLYNKFNVSRTNGSSEAGGKHEHDEYFVLNLTTDKHAIPALAAYAKSCEITLPLLASDLRKKISDLRKNEFITVPETVLPNGAVVPEFAVGKYITGREDDQFAISATATPWVRINYHDARKEAENAGLKLVTELQSLALAHNIANQDINWTGGKVGQGSLFQGIRKGKVDEAQSGEYEPEDDERRWLQLSNGERIFDIAGNCYTWVFDDVQGNENGIVSSAFADDSVSLSAPYPSMEKGVGWHPSKGSDWSGVALVRGGFWGSGGRAGVFYLGDGSPDCGVDVIGFRCTKPSAGN